jgi:dihydroorotase
MSILAQVFEEEDALPRLEAFTSLNGPTFYRLPPNEARLTLTKTPPDLPAQIETDNGPVTVFDPGFPLAWSVS